MCSTLWNNPTFTCVETAWPITIFAFPQKLLFHSLAFIGCFDGLLCLVWWAFDKHMAIWINLLYDWLNWATVSWPNEIPKWLWNHWGRFHFQLGGYDVWKHMNTGFSKCYVFSVAHQMICYPIPYPYENHICGFCFLHDHQCFSFFLCWPHLHVHMETEYPCMWKMKLILPSNNEHTHTAIQGVSSPAVFMWSSVFGPGFGFEALHY